MSIELNCIPVISYDPRRPRLHEIGDSKRGCQKRQEEGGEEERVQVPDTEEGRCLAEIVLLAEETNQE